MISKNGDDSEMNRDLKDGGVSCVNGSINSHTLYQCNDSSRFNDMDGDD